MAIIRLSGPEAVRIASIVFKPSQRKSGWVPKSHRISHGHVVDTDDSVVDEVPIGVMPCVALFAMVHVSFNDVVSSAFQLLTC